MWGNSIYYCCKRLGLQQSLSFLLLALILVDDDFDDSSLVPLCVIVWYLCIVDRAFGLVSSIVVRLAINDNIRTSFMFLCSFYCCLCLRRRRCFHPFLAVIVTTSRCWLVLRISLATLMIEIWSVTFQIYFKFEPIYMPHCSDLQFLVRYSGTMSSYLPYYLD